MQKSKANKYPSVKTVSDAQRVGMVKEIFSTITGRYDFLNHLLSLRRDVAWRRFAIKKMRFFRTNRFLDVACGTGDLSINACLKHRHIKAFGVDFVFPMVKTGKEKVKKKGLSGQLNFMQGNALRLPFHDNSFDVTGMAFGIRNIPDKSASAPGNAARYRAGRTDNDSGNDLYSKPFFQTVLLYLFELSASPDGQGVFQKCRRLLLPCRFHYELSITGRICRIHAGYRHVRS